MNRNWLFVALILAAILLSVHLYALHTYAYWRYWWFDIPMHVLGGATLGAFLVGLGITRPKWYFLCMLCVVVGWEVFEYIFGLSTNQPDYWGDTISDMVNGLIGSSITYLIAKKASWR